MDTTATQKRDKARRASLKLLTDYEQSELDNLKKYQGASYKDHIKSMLQSMSLFKIQMGIFHKGRNKHVTTGSTIATVFIGLLTLLVLIYNTRKLGDITSVSSYAMN